MSDDDFDEWLAAHCEATAASPEAAASLAASRAVFVGHWRATAAELGECTARLLRLLRVPKFANEHAEAVARELMEFRAERDARPKVDYSAPPVAGPRCAACGDTGLVAVPLAACVCQPADGPPHLRFHPGSRRVPTGAVLCDAPDCPRGRDARDREGRREAKRKRQTLSAYLRQFGTLDVLGLLREHERAVAEGCRRSLARGGMPDVDGLLREIRRRRAEAERAEAERKGAA